MRRRGLMSNNGKLYDSRIEYLQGDGNAYIDTGIVDKGQYTILAELELSYPIGNHHFAFIYGYSKGWEVSSRALRAQLENTTKTLFPWYNGAGPALYNQTTNLLINDSPSSFTVNNASLWSRAAADIDNNYSMYIFALNKSGTPYFGDGVDSSASIQYKAFKILNVNTILLDYIPVRKDGVGYMYDKISRKLFGNANSEGAFICGPDVEE